VRLVEELIRLLGVHSDDQTALRAGSNRHVAGGEKNETAEHAPLADVGLSSDQLSNPVGEILVVRHTRIIIYARQRCIPVVRSRFARIAAAARIHGPVWLG
jgi:hypothetical protein